MVILSLMLLFVSVVSLTMGLLPDMSKRLIRERVLADVNEEARPPLLSQLAEVLAPINRWLPTGWYSRYMRSRLEAGAVRVAPIHFFVMQEIGALTGLFVYLVTLGWTHLRLGWLVFFCFAGFFVPYLWLSSRIQKRRLSLSRDLPEIVDLLSLCVDAGIEFLGSLGRVVKEYRSCPATEELGTVLQEVRIGKRRRDALRAFATRVQVAEASAFARTLIQADRIGTGTADALRILSDDMRSARYHSAERFAQQAPLKMLMPLVLSMAAALIIVAAPILVQFLQGGIDIQKLMAPTAH